MTVIDREQLRDDILKQCPQPYIFRRDAARISGINQRTLANYDSLNILTAQKIKIGSRVAYMTDSFVDWLVNRIQPV